MGDDIPRPVIRVAGACLAVSAALFARYAITAGSLYHRRGVAAALCVAALVLAGCSRLAPARRVRIAFAVLPSLCVAHAFEVLLAFHRPGPATAAAIAGRSWDSRPMADFLADLRLAGKDAWPSARPRLLYKKLRRGLTIDDREALPLGGIAGVTTVLCKESGAWAAYDADEHGFNNPAGIWSADVEIALVGDSYTQGACVPPDKSFAARIRARHPGTLNLGMLGNGPLFELASMAEFLPAKRPRRVLWVYYHNDLTDLNFEKRIPLLRHYLEEEGFRAGLMEHQPAIDAALKREITAIEGSDEVAWWPRSLRALGLTRQTSPVWLQDLVMSEQNSSFSAFLRLTHVLGLALTERDPEAPSARNPPDFALFEEILSRAKALAGSWGGTLTFVHLPDFSGPDGKQSYPNRAGVLEAARKAGLPIIDVHAAFQARSDVRALLYYPESHCNEAGYQAIGDAILAAIDGEPTRGSE
jgi:hypothetical protein